MANSVDPDQIWHSAASHLGLHCLQRPICPDTYCYYSTGETIVQTPEFLAIIVLKFEQIHFTTYLCV